MPKPLSVLVLGGGSRGRTYSAYSLQYPGEMEVIGIADPKPDVRAYFASRYDLDSEHQFADWRDALSKERMADAVFICTLDDDHTEPALRAMELGYDILLEKPMAMRLHENVRLVQKAEEMGRKMQIGHVLRYTPFWRTLRDVVQSGMIGEVVSLDHRENLHFTHMAHSFVRGNWRNTQVAAPMILAKCCHDFDILLWILRDEVNYINSFGSLKYFTPENAPEGSTAHCTDGCAVADQCKYYAPNIYAHAGDDYRLNIISLTPTREARYEALLTSPYNRCVYRCDNNVVDHQAVTMELKSGATISMLMQGQSEEECRTMRWDGTKATLTARFATDRYQIQVKHHLTGRTEEIPVPIYDTSGHGGGDSGIVRSFLNYVRGNIDDTVTTARESLESHLLAFAAEDARLNRQTIYMPEYRSNAEASAREFYSVS